MASEKLGWLIEYYSCGLFGINMDELRESRRKDRQFTDCLHFVWYFRNKAEGVSLSRLSQAYGRTPRNISAAIAKIVSGIRTQEYYRSRKDAIVNSIIKGTFRQSCRTSPDEKERKEKKSER